MAFVAVHVGCGYHSAGSESELRRVSSFTACSSCGRRLAASARALAGVFPSPVVRFHSRESCAVRMDQPRAETGG